MLYHILVPKLQFFPFKSIVLFLVSKLQLFPFQSNVSHLVSKLQLFPFKSGVSRLMHKLQLFPFKSGVSFFVSNLQLFPLNSAVSHLYSKILLHRYIESNTVEEYKIGKFLTPKGVGDFPILYFFRCLILFLTVNTFRIVLFTFHRAFSRNLFIHC